jgi:glutamate-5-semialdehyde dehydrogenase
MNLRMMGQLARQASRRLSQAESARKDAFLINLADRVVNEAASILAANQLDVDESVHSGLSPALLDRLSLSEERLKDAAAGLRAVAGLPDPVGEVFDSGKQSNGLKIHKQRVPLGVIAVIYEARPNVTTDIVGLALKTGNAVILRGGSETLRTNRTLAALARQALEENRLPVEAVQFIDDPDRQLVIDLLQMYDLVDMLIPRGGASLHQFCRENSRVPVITGGIGICHQFVDDSADLDAAIQVIFNAKVQRPTVCNALDTVLVHQAVAAHFLPRLVESLAPAGVEFRADPISRGFIMAAYPDSHAPASIIPAGPQDFDTEWLSLTLGLKVVSSMDDAIDHIQVHSTGHSDGILTQDHTHARLFIAQVDSAAVYVNASTRFTDGNQFGLGAEVAISTQRLHARGPMGLRELTTYKWVVRGDYHVRD